MEIFASKTSKLATVIVVLLVIAAIALPIYISTLERDDVSNTAVETQISGQGSGKGASGQESTTGASGQVRTTNASGQESTTTGASGQESTTTGASGQGRTTGALGQESTGSTLQASTTTTSPEVHDENPYVSNGTLKFSEREFYLSDTRLRILSGAVHYFRTVPEYWEDRLSKLKACGLNTVET